MSENILSCAGCGTHIATLRDAKVPNGMVVYCAKCNLGINPPMCLSASKSPGFLRWLSGRKEMKVLNWLANRTSPEVFGMVMMAVWMAACYGLFSIAWMVFA